MAQGLQACLHAGIDARVVSIDGQIVPLVAGPGMGVERFNFNSCRRFTHML